MAYKPKTRFIVTISGAQRELFSVRDRGAEGLVIVKRSAGQSDEPIGSTVALKEERISFHPSRNSKTEGAITLKFTMVAEDGAMLDASSFVHIKNKMHVWPFLIVRMHDINTDRNTADIREKDDAIEVASYDKDHTLLYTIVAAHPLIPKSELDKLPYRYKIVRCQTFSIVLMFGFMLLGRFPYQYSVLYSTSSLRKNKKVPPINILHEPRSVCIHDLPKIVKYAFPKLQEQTMSQLRLWYKRHNTPLDQKTIDRLLIMSSTVYRDPLPERSDKGE